MLGEVVIAHPEFFLRDGQCEFVTCKNEALNIYS